MKNINSILAMSSILLFSCGDNTPNTTSVEESNAPVRITNTVFTLSIDNMPSSGLPKYLPLTESLITQFFGDVNDYYWQSDQYTGWQYRGNFEYSRSENNSADLAVTMANSQESYKMRYTFADAMSGQWQLDILENNSTNSIALKGSFTVSDAPSAQDYAFKGTISTDHQFFSAITDTNYPYHIYLPENYLQSSADFPIIIATDGQWEFWRFAHAIETSGLDIILVAIEQGGDDRRLHDYALIGSHQYLDFLASEMLPFIASQYRIDESNLAIQGASWGGLLVRHALIREANISLFNKFIAMDGSYFHENELYLELEQSAFKSNSLISKKLYLSGAAISGNNALVQQYQIDLETHTNTGLSTHFQSFDVPHGKVTTPSIKDALNILYKP